MGANSILSKFFRSLPLSDEHFIQLQYFQKFHRWIDLTNPTSFNEKIQFRKLHQFDLQYAHLADKLEVRGYVSSMMVKVI
jgi:hypothetical protein